MLERTAERRQIEETKRQQETTQAEADQKALRENNGASVIQSYMHRYKLRMHFYHLWYDFL